MTSSPHRGSVFTAIDTAFAALSDGPDPIGLHGAHYPGSGLPQGFLSLRQIRAWMLAHPGRDGYAARNTVWRHLVLNARSDAGWMTAALGMALPALIRAAVAPPKPVISSATR
jgi:hypothetical protein